MRDDGPRLGDTRVPRVVVGLSGGADSLALTAACVAEAMGAGIGAESVHAVVVDHGLQEGSADVARRAAETARGFGATADVIRVDVPGGTDGAGQGPEAAARVARHAALHAVARRAAAPLLLAHTLDDQAETVLLGLARGAGPSALSGIAPDRTWDDGVRVLRPLLALRRDDTEAACDELGLEPWHDPHNDDPRHARVRVRSTALPMLEELLGPGVAANLARTADLVRADSAVLDSLADEVLAQACHGAPAGGVVDLDVGVVVTQPDAVRTRTLHEETRRVFRARVVNPRWMSAMRAHGYKGAFEMAATVDYLFGYDATTGVMDDWMYETLTDEYVANPENREFFDKSNPWALHDISERLLEAADRKMWESPDEERLELLRRTFLETEGELEDR